MEEPLDSHQEFSYRKHFFSREKRQLERELQMYKKMAVQQRKDIFNSKTEALFTRTRFHF